LKNVEDRDTRLMPDGIVSNKAISQSVSTVKLGKEPSLSRLRTGREGGSRAIDHAGHCVDWLSTSTTKL
jgi:hypothetical protein